SSSPEEWRRRRRRPRRGTRAPGRRVLGQRAGRRPDRPDTHRHGGRAGHRRGGCLRARPVRRVGHSARVAIAISLVPPLVAAGLLLEVHRYHDALGALLLFATNVAAIVATGVVVLLLFRVRPPAGGPSRTVRR